MTVHSKHPDSHEAGLSDGCPRCAEHAEHPHRSLDARNLSILRQRIREGLVGRSRNEQLAMSNLAAYDSDARHPDDKWSR